MLSIFVSMNIFRDKFLGDLKRNNSMSDLPLTPSPEHGCQKSWPSSNQVLRLLQILSKTALKFSRLMSFFYNNFFFNCKWSNKQL